MSARPRQSFAKLAASDLPDQPGVYAFYRGGVPVYVGKADRQSLRGRVWKSHRGRGTSMTNSALRRNVAAMLGIAAAADIKALRYTPTTEDAKLVNAWIDACEIAWIACSDGFEASRLEDDLKVEHKPPLTKL
jgi:hypothetical protein